MRNNKTKAIVEGKVTLKKKKAIKKWPTYFCGVILFAPIFWRIEIRSTAHFESFINVLKDQDELNKKFPYNKNSKFMILYKFERFNLKSLFLP